MLSASKWFAKVAPTELNDNILHRYGRVNYVLAQRLELLDEVGRLQESLGVTGDVSYTCETAGHFFLYQVWNVVSQIM